MNRSILADMLGEEYEILEAENGLEAVSTIQKHHMEIDLLLLDIVMPEMDGFEVLTVMNRNNWIEDIPVIMISAETAPAHIERAYNLGVTDFITRPFNALLVHRRVVNTTLLYAKQKKLVSMVADQIYEKERQNTLMIDILSHIVEFRNGESGQHVIHIRMLTELFLRRLVLKTNRYQLSPVDINLICIASALHDVGKIAIPGEILNKPGRFTEEEFAVMKEHTTIGSNMMEAEPIHGSLSRWPGTSAAGTTSAGTAGAIPTASRGTTSPSPPRSSPWPTCTTPSPAPGSTSPPSPTRRRWK